MKAAHNSSSKQYDRKSIRHRRRHTTSTQLSRCSHRPPWCGSVAATSRRRIQVVRRI